MREFTTIKHNPSTGLVLAWQTEVKSEDGEDIKPFVSSFKSSQAPHEGFLKAMQALAPDIPVHCELPADWYKERIRILGASISYDDAGLKGASIQSKVGLHSGKTISINGPHLLISGEAHELLEEACVFRLRNLIKEAENILKTVASRQTELFPASMPETGKDAETKPAKGKTSAKTTAKADETGGEKGKGGGPNGSSRRAIPARQATPSTSRPRRAAASR